MANLNNKGFQTQRKILHKASKQEDPHFREILGCLITRKREGGGEVGEEVEREVDGLGLNNGLHPTNRA